MERSGALMLCLTVLLLTKLCFGQNGEVKLPSSVTASIGSCVLVPCQTTPYSEVIWYKYKGFGYPLVYSETNTEVIEEFQGRTSVQGKNSEGNCTLRIDNIQQLHQDQGVYVYVHEQYFYKPYTVINVVKPQIQMKVANRTQLAGRVFYATCQIRHSCPTPPKMEWMGFVPEAQKVTNTENGNGFWSVVATAAFRAKHQDQGRTLSCRSVFSSGNEAVSNGEQLDILYAPGNVEVVYQGTSELLEGGEIKLTCNSVSKPGASDSDYQWHVIPQNITIQGKGRVVVLKGLRRETSVSCVVSNRIGKQESKWLSLKVNYPPAILLNSSCSDLDGSLLCECHARSQPTPSFSWIVDGRNATSPEFNITSFESGSTAVLERAGTLGNVTCRAQNYLGKDEYRLHVQFQSALMEERTDAVLSAGVAVVCLVLVTATIACIATKKRRGQIPALNGGSDGTEARIRGNLGNKSYSEPYANNGNNAYLRRNEMHCAKTLESDDDLYVNTTNQSEDPAEESCLYENFG